MFEILDVLSSEWNTSIQRPHFASDFEFGIGVDEY